jgi:hypothetical protein
MAKSPPATEDAKPEIWERWNLGPWQFTQWRDYDSGEPEMWYRFGPVRERVTAHEDRYRSLGEAMLVAVAEDYETDVAEATWTAFMCARLIGMHVYDGDEWVYQPPRVVHGGA